MREASRPLSAEAIAAAFGIEAASVAPIGSGLINQTFGVTARDGGRFVLQRLHEIFPAGVNEDIGVVTRHLLARGMKTPVLVPATDGRLWVETTDGVWRMMNFVEGVVVDRVESEARAREAGALLGRFHVALADLDYDFPNARSGIHDTPRHLENLRAALIEHRGHGDFERIAKLGDEVLKAADDLPPLPATPDRVVHGDPKISNFVFDAGTGRGVCLVDLDTLNRMPLPLELGDAMRSWCNPAGEDTASTGFSIELFSAALAGYASRTARWVTRSEWESVVPATLTIMVELAARFCADALQDRYFGWDATRFASRSEHNFVRARGQLEAFRECRGLAGQLDAAVEQVLVGAGPA